MPRRHARALPETAIARPRDRQHAVVALLAACNLLVLSSAPSCRRSTPHIKADRDAAAGARTGGTSTAAEPLVLPAEINTSIVVGADSRVRIPWPVRVVRGGSLELERGVRLAFEKDSSLRVDGGKLTAKGSDKSPVVFTSASAKPAPGDWGGLTFLEASAGSEAANADVSVLEYVTLEFGGGPQPCEPHPCLGAGVSFMGHRPPSEERAGTLRPRVQLHHVRLQHNAVRGLYVEGVNVAPQLADVTFGPNGGTSAQVPFSVVDQLGISVPEALAVGGEAHRTIALPKAGMGYLFNKVTLRAEHGPAELVIPTGTTVRFERAGSLSILGIDATARLVARDVTFTSAADTPAPGDWRGLNLSLGAEAELEGNVFEYAGGSSDAVLDCANHEQVHISQTTFRHNAAPAIAARGCATWLSPGLANSSLGQPLCVPVDRN